MLDDPKAVLDAFDGDEAFSMLQELSANTPEELRLQRAHFRLTIKAGIVLQAANASELLNYKVKGVTGDVSQGGLSAVFPIPVRVGDVYRLQVDPATLDIPLTFARCVRCRLVREDAFEAGFAFFADISLPENCSVDEASNVVT